ncbi:MAG: AMP-binding protein [Christensenellaceae bacterium]|jgi:acetyl-CoA synthetase|nr:AMP-binding protein [Christensenellaceae bacterium]
MNLLSKYINRTTFADYNDFANNISFSEIDEFNFGFDVVDEYARISPEKRALVWCDDSGNEKILTFKDLSILSNKTANMFLDKGIKKGDFVMTMLNRRYEYYIVVVALCKIGAIIIPATCLLTPKDIEYRCLNADVKAIISTNEIPVNEAILQARKSLPLLQYLFSVASVMGFLNIHNEIAKYPDVLVECEKPTINDKMLVYFTSGTTGYPKMVTHSFKYPLGHIMTAYFWQAVEDDGLHFTMAETGWAKFSWGKIYGQWISGSAVFCYDYFGRFTPTDVLPLISKYKITTFCAPPTIYRFLIREDLSQYDFSSLSSCTTAGEPLNAEVFKLFKQFTGISIREGFGQSESAVILATFRYCQPKPGSMGFPAPIYDLHIMDGDKDITSSGKVGEITIKLKENQFGLLIGYHKDPQKTTEALEFGYYATGDLAYKDDEGYYWFVGRKDDIIKSSGYRIGPFEVESALQEHPSVLECAVTGVPDPLRGQIVKATIVLASGYSPSDELKKEIQEHVKNATAPYKYPRVIEFVDALPKTISGKIKRKDIRKQ